MEIFIAIVLFLIAGVIVAKGADFFVDAATWTSDVTGISRVLIGATVVAIATSGPELFVSLFASLQGSTDMSTGNVVGSHLCNLGIGFALIAIFRPSKNSDKLYVPNALFTLLTAALLLLFYVLGVLTILHAIILLLIYAVFTYVNIRYSQPEQAELSGDEQQLESPSASTPQKCAKKPTNKKEIIINLLKYVGGLAGIIIGSKLIVDNATVLAKAMGVSEMIIGLTIVAIGTSLPEIVTTIAALIKKENDLGIGNIFGSCVFNNSFIIPVSTFIVGSLTFNPSVIVDLPVALALTLITIIPTVIGKKIYRAQGIAVATVYLSYLVYLVASS